MRGIHLGIIVGFALSTGLTKAQDYSVLLPFENIQTESWNSAYHGSFCYDGPDAYCLIRGEIVDDGEWGSYIVKVSNFETSPANMALVSNAQWKAFTGNGLYDTILPGTNMRIVGDKLILLDQTTDSIYQIDKNTGAISYLASQGQIAVFLGLATARLNSECAFTPDGSLAFYETNSDNVLMVDPEGNLSVFITKAEFQSLYGYLPNDAIYGDMAFDLEGRFYWALSKTSGTGEAGGRIYRRDCDGSMTRMITMEDIWDVTFGYANVGFNCMTVAPDGKLYFYDRVDFFGILYFDVNDPNLPHTTDDFLPAGVINIYLDPDQLSDGPAQSKYVTTMVPRGTDLTFNEALYPPNVGHDIYRKPLVGKNVTMDLNGDGETDAADVTVFEACSTGPGIGYSVENLPEGCIADCFGVLRADADRDGDVDAVDFAALQRAFTFGAE